MVTSFVSTGGDHTAPGPTPTTSEHCHQRKINGPQELLPDRGSPSTAEAMPCFDMECVHTGDNCLTEKASFIKQDQDFFSVCAWANEAACPSPLKKIYVLVIFNWLPVSKSAGTCFDIEWAICSILLCSYVLRGLWVVPGHTILQLWKKALKQNYEMFSSAKQSFLRFYNTKNCSNNLHLGHKNNEFFERLFPLS